MKNCAEKFIYPSLRGLEQAEAISIVLGLLAISAAKWHALVSLAEWQSATY